MHDAPSSIYLVYTPDIYCWMKRIKSLNKLWNELKRKTHYAAYGKTNPAAVT